MTAPQTPVDGRRRFNPSRWAIEHASLTRYLMWVFLLLGVVAYFQLPQDEDPPFVFRVMVVQAAWPGATAQEVAEQVTDKIERALQEAPYVDVIRSYAKPGESLTLFQLREDVRKEDVQQTWYQVRKKVGDIRPTLPQGVQGPFFNDEFGDVYGSIFVLSADGFSDEELRRFAEQVRNDLLRVPDVAKVDLFGVQPEKVYVEISAQRLAQLGLDWSQLIAQIGAQNTVESAGLLKAGERDLQVRVGGQYRSVDDVARLPVRGIDAVTGQPRLFRLGDIATLRRAYADPPAVKVRFAGAPVIAIGVSMAKGGDILQLGKRLRARVPVLQAQLPVGVELHQVLDQPQTVSEAVNEFVGTLAEAVVIVLAVSFLALGLHRSRHRLGWRVDVWPGVIIAITIPLVLAITFIAMHYWGIGLHKISLGSLIIALGLLVDDAIIAVEMMVRKLEEGHDRLVAATYAYEVTAKPMLTGTLITAAGFLPIGLARSTTGEYTFAIFAVTTVSLLLSWVVSVYFVPYLGVRLLRVKPAQEGGAPHELFDSPFYNRLRRLLNACVARRWWTIGFVVLSFVLGLFGMTRVQQQFFPDSNRPEILVDLWLPEGANQAASEAAVKRFERLMAKEKGLESNLVWVGSGLPRFFLPLDQVFPQPNVSQALLRARSLPDRDDLVRRLPALLSSEVPEVRVRVKLLQQGPPVQYPVQFRVIGPDPAVLRNATAQLRELMLADTQLLGINDNWNESVMQLRLDVDDDQARTLGVSRQAIVQATRTLLSGTPVAEYREEDRLIQVVLRQPATERQGIEDLTQTYVLSSTGKAIPLAQLVRVSQHWEPGVMWRESRQFAITVNADVPAGVQGPSVSARIWPKVQALAATWPAGYRVEVAGAAEQNGKGQESILAGMPVMVFIILTLLMLQLKSFGRSVLVLVTGPLGISGVAAALLLLGRPFGFVALLGVIALTGMIMRNSVILIDQIEYERARGVPAWEAVVESAVRRFRPIVLTAAAAVLAMIPLSRSVFWGPMAVAIMGGLIVATALTVLGLPAMYAAWFRVRRTPPTAAG